MADLFQSHSRSARLDQVLRDLLGQAPELQAASVVSFDGLPMASALPSGMDEDRVAAMSAALLSLGERAAESFGRGSLNQVYVEGDNGTVFLVSADDEAVLVAVGAKGAKVGLLMFEVRRSAVSVADALRADDLAAAQAAPEVYESAPVAFEDVPVQMAVVEELPVRPEPEQVPVAQTLHVVEDVQDESADPEYGEPAGPAGPTEPYTTPYEPVEPYSTPYAEELPPPSPSPWGTPLTAVSKPDAPRRDANHWTAYDQTNGEPGNWV
jgi:predicted regulator of Ras-like GTPase activity (Roadblock/LC7/MglB family)